MNTQLKQVSIATLAALGVSFAGFAVAQGASPTMNEPVVITTTTTYDMPATEGGPPSVQVDGRTETTVTTISPASGAMPSYEQPAIFVEKITLTPSNDMRLKPLINANVDDMRGNSIGKVTNIVVADSATGPVTYAVVDVGSNEDMMVQLDTGKLDSQLVFAAMYQEKVELIVDVLYGTANVATPVSHG